MKIPLSYNLRNLAVRRTTTLMTALGIALTVAVLLSVMALVEGLRSSLTATAQPLNVLVTRKSATSELTSIMTRSMFQDLRGKQGIARGIDGRPLASLELVTVIVLEGDDLPAGININVRGVTETGLAVREHVRLREGRWFTAGRREAVVGRSVADRYSVARMGNKLKFGRGEWEIVGVMDAGRGAANSEIFVDLNQIATDQNRPDGLSTALLRASDAESMQALINDLETDRRLTVTARSEKSYYEEQTSAGAPIQIVGTFVAIVMAVGSGFAAMNTMYAAVARRSAEIGTLRVLGFPRRGILLSFLIESLLLAFVGGVIGCVLVLPLNNFSTGLGSFVTFSEISFELRVTPKVMMAGMTFALAMGAFGGLFPAAAAARKDILAALKQG